MRDEDVITVTRAKSSEPDAPTEYTICSLAPAADAQESNSATRFKLRTTASSDLPGQFLDKHLFQGLPAYLGPDENVRHVLISTRSGTGLASGFFDEVLEPLLSAIGLKASDYNVVQTKNTDSVKEFARGVLLVQANEGKKQTVLMLSGDGGVVDTINGLLEDGDRSR